MTYREKTVQIVASWVGKTEVGYNNRGPFVEMLQRADGLAGEGYAWCQTTMNAAWRLATGGKIVRKNGRDDIVGGQMLLGGTASVGLFVGEARKKGMIVTRPFRGDFVAFQFTGDTWPDHVGIVERVLQVGPVWILQTLEGNTSPGDGGSQDDGGGIYRRRRVVRSSKVIFVRVPDRTVPPPPPPPPPPKKPEWRVTIEKPKGTVIESFKSKTPGKDVHARGIVAHRYDRVLIERL